MASTSKEDEFARQRFVSFARDDQRLRNKKKPEKTNFARKSLTKEERKNLRLVFCGSLESDNERIYDSYSFLVMRL